MKRIFLIVTFFAALTTNAAAQKAGISGTVKDEQGNSLPGAAVYVHDIKRGVIADSAGKYRIQSIPAGQYLIEVSHIGFGSVTELVNITQDVIHDFVLHEQVIENQGVIITGVATATKLRQTTQPVTLVRRNDLLKTVSTNIIDALAKEPGISSLSTGPAIAKPVIRGLGYNRMVVINDGIRQEGQQWGDEHGIEVDEYSIQRAEILKGPASLMYGSDAMAGVINLVTNVPVEQGTIKGNVLTNANSNNEMLGVSANLAAHFKTGFNLNLYTSLKSAGDYRNKFDGRVFNSRFNENNSGGYFGVNKNWGYSHILFSSFHQKTGLIEGERDDISGRFLVFSGSSMEREATEREMESRKMFTPYQDIRHYKITTDNNIRLPMGRMNVTVGYQQNKRLEFGNAADLSVPDLSFDLQTINYNIQYHSPSSKKSWATSFGLNGMYQQNQNKAAEVLIPEYNQFDIGAFVFTQKTFPDFTISGGIRSDLRKLSSKELMEGGSTKFTGFDKTFSNISGSAGISYDVNKKLTLKLNVARAFRAPNVAELSSNGAHEGTNRYEYGQQNLESETSFQLDAGLELNTTHFGLSVSTFYNNIRNYIFYRKLISTAGNDSVVVVDGKDHTAFRFDQSTAALYGFELSFDLHPHPLDWLHVESNLSYVKGVFHSGIDGSNNLPFIPATKWNTELRTDFRKVKSFKNVYLKLEAEHVFQQNRIFTAYQTETATPGYTLFNIGFGFEIGDAVKISRGFSGVSLHFAVNNFTDVAYQSHLSRLKYTDVNNVTGRQGVFNQGRNFNVKLNVPLSFTLK